MGSKKKRIVKRFAKGCANKTSINGKRLRFFRVPEGIEGFFWARAVKARRKHYKRGIELLSSSTSEEKRAKFEPTNIQYCCELHFNVETDVEKIFAKNGSLLKYQIKSGVFPTLNPSQTEDSVGTSEMFQPGTHEVANCENVVTNSMVVQSYPTKHFEIVELSTLNDENSINDTQADSLSQECDMETNSHDQHGHLETSSVNKQMHYEPLTSLIVDLMKRKSLFYTGLQPSSLSSLLQMTEETTEMTEPQIMLTLRKLRLNEDFVLGDLFDIDKATAEQYFEECTILVSAIRSLYPNSKSIDNTMEESIIKLEPYDVAENASMNEEQMDFDKSHKSNNVMEAADQDEDGFESTGDSSDNSKSSETLPCPLCPKYVHRLENHINEFHSSPLNINKTICGLCITKFKSTKMLRAHQIDCHNGHAFACDLCTTSFTNYSTMKQHIFKKHSKLKLQSCHLCDKKYFTASSLQTHVHSVHTGEQRPFQCNFSNCRKSFWKKSYFTEHQNVHKPKFTCEICAKTFGNFKRNFLIHQRNVHGILSGKLMNLLSQKKKSEAINPNSNNNRTMEATINAELTIKVEPNELAENSLMI